MKQVSYIAAATVVLALATPAMAFGPGGGGKHGPRMDFETLDTDGNGEVTKAELQAFGQARFAKADADGDGKLTAAELTEARLEQARRRIEAKVQKMLEAMDKDGDGLLSAEEMGPAARAEARAEARRDRMFDRFDADDDGAVSREEAQQAMAMMQQRRHDRSDGVERRRAGGSVPRHDDPVAVGIEDREILVTGRIE